MRENKYENKLERFVIFNKTHLKIEREVQDYVWQSFWDSIIFTKDQYKSAKALNSLTFVQTDSSPPYLKNFAGSV